MTLSPEAVGVFVVLGLDGGVDAVVIYIGSPRNMFILLQASYPPNLEYSIVALMWQEELKV